MEKALYKVSLYNLWNFLDMVNITQLFYNLCERDEWDNYYDMLYQEAGPYSSGIYCGLSNEQWGELYNDDDMSYWDSEQIYVAYAISEKDAKFLKDIKADQLVLYDSENELYIIPQMFWGMGLRQLYATCELSEYQAKELNAVPIASRADV